jgi:hypothetical protein
METVTSDPWLDMTTVAHGYFHRQDFHLLDKQLGSLHYPSILAVPVGCRLRKEWARTTVEFDSIPAIHPRPKAAQLPLIAEAPL